MSSGANYFLRDQEHNLEERLREILERLEMSAFKNEGTQTVTQSIPQIRQVFIDAGWIPGRMTPKGYLATGQEWYTAFEKELDKHLEMTDSPWDDLAMCILAAKKAAGISDE